ncbi:MAG: TraB/GumN family protein [Bacteroidetes bacterium]|nr:TraB/GumN family protein [Bacteroidota bacterium]MBU1677459.1 TraB/GumN family protein [Bacteroidota bacterium]MBU2505277.1 TraB/GumN family protein [Bacteroidota bacterium]
MPNAVVDSEYGPDVKVFDNGVKKYFIIGTAHISKKSANLVRTVIEKEKPDRVCIELDSQRYKALSEKKKWDSLTLKEVMKQKQLSTLLINILLSSYQKKLGEKLGVIPGIELLEAANTAKELSIPIELCDRDVRITLKRAWNFMSFWNKLKFLTVSLAGLFEQEEITEAKLEEIKETDVLNELMAQLGKSLPILKTVLIDERDSYLTTKMKAAEGEVIVSVVGAGHVKGICNKLIENEEIDLKEIEKIPPPPITGKIIGWGIPLIIVASIIFIGLTKGFDEAGSNVIYWILANGIPSAIGTLLALGHPITIITAFLAAPLTSLTPVIGAGYVAAFIQLYFAPPVVKEFETVSEDIGKFGMWWKNKLLKILLVFILSGLGSVIGTYVGAYEIISNIF